MIDKILEFETPWLLYYAFYDTPELPNEERVKIFKKLNQLGDEVYLGRALYYYFNVLSLRDNHIIGHNVFNLVVRTICPLPKFPFERLINNLLIWKEKK